jgi:large subunit ribosomal protein L6
MSRIGNAPIEIPDKVDVAVDGRTITVKGPKGELSRTLHEAVEASVEDGQIVIARGSDERDVKALHGLMRALVNNMVVGVTEGFQKELSIVGVGYRAAKNGSELELLVGFSHPVVMGDVEGVTVEVPEPTKIIVSGIDKETVGQVAANIRDVKPPEPYKGKGIRYVDEHVVRKAGKAGVR